LLGCNTIVTAIIIATVANTVAITTSTIAITTTTTPNTMAA